MFGLGNVPFHRGIFNEFPKWFCPGCADRNFSHLLSTINWSIHFAEAFDGVGGDEFLGYLARVNYSNNG